MELQRERREAPPIPSASVILLRDGEPGLEVFLLKRHGLSDVHGGAYVFPGGKVDREDAEWIDRLDTSPEQLHQRLGEPELSHEDAAMLFVAAVREVFEESGLLFAPVSGAQASAAWAALREGPRFGELLEPWDLTLATDALVPWSRWVTPVIPGLARKRFDTRFFVATVPEGQNPLHDEHEAVASVWRTPRAALAEHLAGHIELAAPQIMSLAHLARHGDVASALATATGRKPPCIRPQPIELDEGRRVLCYPGDPQHAVAERAWPGPTRLLWRGGRFEPEGGLEGLLSD
jgi:8-oxo-dGTP pyrophosphatase MutT (NUDIX family)